MHQWPDTPPTTTLANSFQGAYMGLLLSSNCLKAPHLNEAPCLHVFKVRPRSRPARPAQQLQSNQNKIWPSSSRSRSSCDARMTALIYAKPGSASSSQKCIREPSKRYLNNDEKSHTFFVCHRVLVLPSCQAKVLLRLQAGPSDESHRLIRKPCEKKKKKKQEAGPYGSAADLC